MAPEKAAVWDACALLNLLATDCAPGVLASLGCDCLVEAGLREEVHYLRPLPEDRSSAELVPVRIDDLIAGGALTLTELRHEDELALFVSLAERLGDGEARSLAVASCRGLRLVTDDRAALRTAAGLQPSVPCLTTPEWVRLWAERTRQEARALRAVLRRIEVRARYLPPRTHPLRGWWEERLE